MAVSGGQLNYDVVTMLCVQRLAMEVHPPQDKAEALLIPPTLILATTLSCNLLEDAWNC